MNFLRAIAVMILVLVVVFAGAACPGGAPTPTAAPPVSATPTATVAAAPSPVSGVSISDLAARARGLTQYSVDLKVTAAGQTVTGKSYVKTDKMRQETTTAGVKTVTLIDMTKKTGYFIMVAQNTATKLDFSQVATSEQPAEEVAALPSDARFVGTETIDGKSASVYQYTSAAEAVKIWIWTERGLPLKVETTSGGAQAVIEFTNYDFGPLADSLFELPPGVQVVGVPAIPGISLTPTR